MRGLHYSELIVPTLRLKWTLEPNITFTFHNPNKRFSQSQQKIITIKREIINQTNPLTGDHSIFVN